MSMFALIPRPTFYRPGLWPVTLSCAIEKACSQWYPLEAKVTVPVESEKQERIPRGPMFHVGSHHIATTSRTLVLSDIALAFVMDATSSVPIQFLKLSGPYIARFR